MDGYLLKLRWNALGGLRESLRARGVHFRANICLELPRISWNQDTLWNQTRWQLSKFARETSLI